MTKCSPSCTTYRLATERSADVADWTRAELVAEVRKMQNDLRRTERAKVAAERQAHIAQRRLESVPRFLRWLFRRGAP